MALLECISLSDMSISAMPESTVVCLGNFDGVHLAHRALMKETKRLRDAENLFAACCVFCFRVPSSDFLLSAPPAHLGTLAQKLACFRDEGMDFAILADFEALRELSPLEFAEKILKKECHCRAAVCGFNFRFGKNGDGDAVSLQSLLNLPVSVQNEITLDGMTVSSTNIRRLLSQGDTEQAARLLGRPYSFIAPVVHGKALGKTIGIPTVNQFFPQGMLIPRHGVYITDCAVEGRVFRGVSNVGVHPTVDRKASLNCETHLLDCNMDLYGKEITVHFLKYLREEQKFDSIDSLKAQIRSDIRSAKEYH